MNHATAGILDIAYAEHGPADGRPVVLLHGFPYDHHGYDAVAAILAGRGLRCIVPALRGFGETRFRSAGAPRSGQQAAVGADLLALMDALSLPRAVLAGYDWGGRAACVVAALHPARVSGLVSGEGYAIQDIAGSGEPKTPEAERRLWYQYYFHSERGRAGLAADRDAFCRLLWQLWSPEWRFDDATFARSAAAFANPDFVDVVIHSYRHRFGLVPGDPAYDAIEAALAATPPIAVPTIALFGGSDGVSGSSPPPPTDPRFTGRYEARVLPGIGHNLPQEAPAAFAQAVLDLC